MCTQIIPILPFISFLWDTINTTSIGTLCRHMEEACLHRSMCLFHLHHSQGASMWRQIFTTMPSWGNFEKNSVQALLIPTLWICKPIILSVFPLHLYIWLHPSFFISVWMSVQPSSLIPHFLINMHYACWYITSKYGRGQLEMVYSQLQWRKNQWWSLVLMWGGPCLLVHLKPILLWHHFRDYMHNICIMSYYVIVWITEKFMPSQPGPWAFLLSFSYGKKYQWE